MGAADTAVPPEVADSIAIGLGVPHVALARMAGGTNGRTFRVSHAGRRWVARVERAPAPSLRRAVDAQERARAAGVRAPQTLAHGAAETAGGRFVWSVETLARGRPFTPQALTPGLTLAAAADLGHQLRRLHTVAVDAFGDLPPRPYPVYPTFTEWAVNKARRVTPAAEIVGGDPQRIPEAAAAYAALTRWYGGPPVLCKGDCAGDNILVDAQGRATVIDWEWAQGLDPAADVAFWCAHTPDPRARAALLAAYAPDDPSGFSMRIWAHQVVQCVETVHVYHELRGTLGDAACDAGARAAWESLTRLLAAGP